MEYRTIPTTLGRAKLEQAALLQVPLELTLVEFGDGNGAEYLPTGQETALKRKVYEAAPNMLADAEESETWVELHAVLPFDVGGWWLREFIVRDAAGDAIFIGNLPESFKPIGSTGAIKDIAFELVFDILSPDSVTLKVDPSKVLATRKFVEDYVAQELAKLDAKQSVRVATTAAIALSGLLSVDGVQLVAGDRVLVKNQANGAQNGIYVAAAGAWARANDADASLEVTPGMLVPVEQGTVNADSVWQLVTDAPINLGATVLAFEVAAGPTGLAVGTYRSITVDKRGRVIGGSNPESTDDYGLTDAIYRRNLIVDGGCRVAQLAAKALNTSAQYGAVDMFAAWAGGAVSAGSIAHNTSGIGRFGTSLHLSGVTLTGSGVVYARHRIESAIARELKNKQASLSVLVQHDVGASISYTLTLRKANAADNFSAVTLIAASEAINVPSGAATLLRFENVAMGDCSAGIEVEVSGSCGAVIAKGFQFSDWQLEQGAKATRFACEGLSATLQAVERYLEKSYDLATLPGTVTMNGATIGDASSVSDITVDFRTRKRTVPTVSYWSALTGLAGSMAFSNTMTSSSPSGNLAVYFSRASEINLQVESLPGDGYMPIVHFVADARL
jgi:phage-related tail fiber protein